MRNLIDLRVKQEYSIRSIKIEIENNLNPLRYARTSHYGLYNGLDLTQRIARKAELRHFGKFFNLQKKDGGRESANEVCEYLNDNQWIRSIRDWHDLLDDNFYGSYFSCHDCGYVGSGNDSHNVMDDYSVCNSCRDNYYWSDRYGNYQNEPDEEDEEENSGYDNIGCYHSSKHELVNIPSSFDQRKPRVLLGLELEMECKSSDYDKDSRAGHLLDAINKYRGHTYALCEEDGSLDDGFEMVTGYTGLDVHKDQLQFFKHTFKGMSSHNTETCGLHGHICKSNMTTLHGAKMVFFINDTNNYQLVKAIARRDAGYGKIKDKKSDTSWLKDAVKHKKDKRSQLKGLNSDRYEALNFNNDKTIEFRLFKGSLKYETIMACLEFTYATWHFCKDASIDQLTSELFIQFICKPQNKFDTRFLRVYLKNKGFEMACSMPSICPDHLKKVA
jgi:hypothetical protein